MFMEYKWHKGASRGIIYFSSVEALRFGFMHRLPEDGAHDSTSGRMDHVCSARLETEIFVTQDDVRYIEYSLLVHTTLTVWIVKKEK